jgi:hypothetical protein
MRVGEKFYLEQIWTDAREELNGDGELDPELGMLAPDDAPGGDTDQNVVDELGEAFGLLYDLGEELHCGDKEMERDRHRWELDPASAEDYGERSRHNAGWRWRHFNH